MKGIWAKVIVVVGVLLSLASVCLLFGSGGERYKSLTQEEAEKIMRTNDDYMLVDVRTWAEYDGGHIPGAACVPIDDIRDRPETVAETFPDKHQVLLIYCYSGRRAADAAKLLASMGYTNAYEFGGIVDWTGDIVAE